MKRLLLTMMMALCLCAGTPLAGPLEDAAAIRILRPLAEQGNADAQQSLGYLHEVGQGTERHFAEALRWYRLSAAQGNAAGQNSLGVMYATGQGVARDDVEALKWYRLAAAGGDTLAQERMGLT